MYCRFFVVYSVTCTPKMQQQLKVNKVYRFSHFPFWRNVADGFVAFSPCM